MFSQCTSTALVKLFAISSFVFYNRGSADRPFADSPDATFDLDSLTGNKKLTGPLLRDSVPTADFNGDGIVDLILNCRQCFYAMRLWAAIGYR